MPPRSPVDPYADTYQQIPEDLFTLTTMPHADDRISHEQFFLLATLHKECQMKSDGAVPLAIAHLAERTCISVRKLWAHIGVLKKRDLLLVRKSEIKGKTGHKVNEYAVNWQRVHLIAGKERERRRRVRSLVEGERRLGLRTEQNRQPRRQALQCPVCGQNIHPFRRINERLLVAARIFAAAKPAKAPEPTKQPPPPAEHGIVAEDVSF